MRLYAYPLAGFIMLIGSRIVSAGIFAQSAPIPGSGIEIGQWFEKAGVIGFAVWMIIWFQKRTDRQTETLQGITERALVALEKSNESDRENAKALVDLAGSVRELRTAVAGCGYREGEHEKLSLRRP